MAFLKQMLFRIDARACEIRTVPKAPSRSLLVTELSFVLENFRSPSLPTQRLLEQSKNKFDATHCLNCSGDSIDSRPRIKSQSLS